MGYKWNINNVREVFEKRNCKLLEKEYFNTSTKMYYKATCGHEHSITLNNFIKGKGDLCKKCRYSAIGEKTNLNFEEVKKIFSENDCILLSKSYKNGREKLKYIAQCGHINFIALEKFKIGNGRVCRSCSKSILYTYDYVKKYFLDNGCELLEKEYINCKTKMKFIAQCQHIHLLTFDEFKNSTASKRCPDCQKVKNYTMDDIIEIFRNNGCRVLINEYNPKKPIVYVAQCSHKNSIKLYKFLRGQGRKCHKCSRPRGEKHHNYNAMLTDEERAINRDTQENIKWRENVYKKDNYTCQKCGNYKGGNLNAHHISGYDKDIENRYNIYNGITLCEKCHKEFHNKFGYGNNTKEQFDKWFNKR